jgi:hypothetical protein
LPTSITMSDRSSCQSPEQGRAQATCDMLNM